MSSSATDIAGLLVTLVVCVVTVVATVINYYVLRASLEPEIVVYPEHDEKRPSLIMLIIKNVGKGSAHNVRFYPQRPIPSRAWGIEKLTSEGKPFESGPIISGIPFLAAGSSRIIDWGQFGGLRDTLNGEIRLSIQYYAKSPFGGFRLITSDSVLEVKSFSATTAAKRNEVEIKSKTLDELSGAVQALLSGTKTVRVRVDEDETKI